MVIRRVGPLSFAKISGLIYAIVGLAGGALFALVSLTASTANPFPAGLRPIFGVGAIVLFPLIYGVLGFVMSLIGAWIYNVIAGSVGGVEIEVTPEPRLGEPVMSAVGE